MTDPYHKKHLEKAITDLEAMSHYRLGKIGSGYDSNDIIYYMLLSTPYSGIEILTGFSYKRALFLMGFYFGFNKSQVDKLICVNDNTMRWARRDVLVKLLKEWLSD